MKYIDKEEEEWQLFQKAIKEENLVSHRTKLLFEHGFDSICDFQVSEHLQDDDDDFKQVERTVEEIDEHM